MPKTVKPTTVKVPVKKGNNPLAKGKNHVNKHQHATPLASNLPTFAHIKKAHARIKQHVHKTPLMTSETLNKLTGMKVFLKCENFQKIGAFKIRGATNAVKSLTKAEAKKGVCTHSSGNHASGLALAAKTAGIPAYIVMPSNAPSVKKISTAGYDA
jgi:threonine dehydratase